MRRWLILAAAVLIAACEGPANVSAPLAEPDETPIDERFLGAWAIVEGMDAEANSMMLVVARRADQLRAAFALTVLDPWAEIGGTSIWYEWVVHPTEIGGRTYFNGRVAVMVRFEAGMAGDRAGIFPVDQAVLERNPVYQIGYAEILPDDRMALSFLRVPTLRKLDLPTRKLSCGEACRHDVYEVTSERLRAIVRDGNHDDLFGDLLIFKRLDGTIPPQPDD